MKHSLASLVIALSLLMGTMAGAWAQDFERGLRAHQSGDFATALGEWILLAGQGDARAQYNLGVMYENGDGVVQDYKEAVKWYRLAAEQGIAEAQTELGFFHFTGKGVVQDYKEAVKWYRLAAVQGYAEGQYRLGLVVQDDKEKVKWYRLAAEQGHAGAQYNLGIMYDGGVGIVEDNVMAHMWINIAGKNGARSAEYRDFLTKSMTTADISKAQQLARECVAKNYKGC